MKQLLEMKRADKKLIVRFLLGDLPERKRLKLEERIFKEDAFYEEVLAIQEELADDYVHKGLSASQTRRFESHFLQSPLRRERFQFAAALSRALDDGISRSTLQARDSGRRSLRSSLVLASVGWQRLAVAASIAMALLIGISWLALNNRRLNRDVDRASAERDELRRQADLNREEATLQARMLEQEIAELRASGTRMQKQLQQKEQELEALQRAARESKTPLASLATFILTPGLTRGTDEPEKLMLGGGVQTVRLQLNLEREESFKSYVAEIRTARGNLVWSQSALEALKTGYGLAVPVTIPASRLPIGEYEISLKGTSASGKLESVGYFYFISLRR